MSMLDHFLTLGSKTRKQKLEDSIKQIKLDIDKLIKPQVIRNLFTNFNLFNHLICYLCWFLQIYSIKFKIKFSVRSQCCSALFFFIILLSILYHIRVWRRNSTTAEEVSRFQCLLPNPNWLVWKGISPPKTRFNTHGCITGWWRFFH